MDALVLLVCDDPEMARIWAYTLGQRAIDVMVVGSCAEAQSHWAGNPPDLIIIDLYGSPENGVALCRGLRAEVANPILFLIPTTGEAEILEAYKAGADECIGRPISPLIFLAKVQAWLRHSWTVPAEMLNGLQVSGLRLDPGQRQLEMEGGRVVRLTNLELRLLHLLMSHPNRALDSRTLIARVWGYSDGDTTILKNLVYRLRRKVEPDAGHPQYIQTAAGGKGYAFVSR